MISYEQQRREMVETQLVRRGIRDRRVLDAMARIPRELFISPEFAADAYADAPAPIGFGQSISQPYMVALMAELLHLDGTEVMLDVGTGSGYNAAVLCALSRRVYSIEVIPELAGQAWRNLESTGLGSNITVIRGDGSRGYPECMPYDAISVAAGAPAVPGALIEQLADPGRLVIPVGSRDDQDLRVVTKWNGELQWRNATMCRFVLLRGEQGWR
jgi:protein-L-isoaspartate(D-aspartate) O-methyltransferase